MNTALHRILNIIFLVGVGLASTQAQQLEAYKVKAVFLFNFTQFISWPDSAFSEPGAALVVGIYGKDPFGPFLDEVFNGESMGGHPLAVKRCSSLNDILDCHILFIHASESKHVKTILAFLDGRAVLTVGEAPGFTRQGGMVRFLQEDNKIRLRINLGRVKGAGLIASSKLLQLAEIVSPDGNP